MFTGGDRNGATRLPRAKRSPHLPSATSLFTSLAPQNFPAGETGKFPLTGFGNTNTGLVSNQNCKTLHDLS